jgi:hypothetical protein
MPMSCSPTVANAAPQRIRPEKPVTAGNGEISLLSVPREQRGRNNDYTVRYRSAARRVSRYNMPIVNRLGRSQLTEQGVEPNP